MHRDVGVVAAALTPRGKRGEVNFGACFELLDFLCAAKVQGIALLTAAGEYPVFAVDERTRLVYLAAKRSRAPLFAGVGSEDLETSIGLAREALTAGAAAVLLPPPLLLPYPQPELREYYLHFATQVAAADHIWIVDRPPLAADTVRDLMESGRFAGVAGEGLALSTEACAIPEVLVALDAARRAGDARRAEALAEAVQAFQGWAAKLPPLLAIKEAVELRGIPIGPLPVPPAPERRQLVEEFREWFRVWLQDTRKLAANA